LQVVQGQLYLAEKTWNHGLRYADGKLEGKQSLLACTIYSGLGLLYYEWNRLDIAKQHLLSALNIAQRGGLIEIILESSISLGRLLIQQGEHQAGLKMLYDLEPIILAREKTKHAIRAKAYITLWEYMQGNRDHFYNWMRTRQLSLDDTPEYINESEYWILSRLMIREGGREEVLKLLQRIEEAGRTNGRVMTEIKALVLRAGLLERYGETAKALVPLQRALTLAEPGGFIRTFIEASSYMFGLLNKYAARSPQSEYVRRLLSEFEGFAMQQSMVPTLVEPLSNRELEVLQLIAARLSSREIAVELNISVNTARTHIRNIYGKMDVHSHQEVALRAETLGLIH
jgi:LuxR family maltose regulon positive regulatory protein